METELPGGPFNVASSLRRRGTVRLAAATPATQAAPIPAPAPTARSRRRSGHPRHLLRARAALRLLLRLRLHHGPQVRPGRQRDTAAANADTSSNGAAKPAAGSLASQPAEPAAQPAADASAAPAVRRRNQPQLTCYAAPIRNAATPADGSIAGVKPPTRQPTTNNRNLQLPPPEASWCRSPPSPARMSPTSCSFAEEKRLQRRYPPRAQDKLLHVQIGPLPPARKP